MWAAIVLGCGASLLGYHFQAFRRNINAFETPGSEYPVTRFRISEKRGPQSHGLENLKTHRCQCVLLFYVKSILML